MKLTVRDKIIIGIVGLVMILYTGFQTFWKPCIANVTGLENKRAELKGLIVDKAPIDKQIETLEREEAELLAKVSDSSINSVAITKEEFLVFLGINTVNNGAKLQRFYDFGIKNKDDIWQTTYDLEVAGTAYGINKLLNDIKDLGMQCKFSSFSFRQNADNQFLTRTFDELTKLPWFAEQKGGKDEGKDFPVSNEMRLAFTMCFMSLDEPFSADISCNRGVEE